MHGERHATPGRLGRGPVMSGDPLGREGAAAYYLEVIAGGVEDY